MKALLLHAKNQLPSIGNVPPPDGTRKKIVHLKAAALNHRDVWIMKGMYPGINYPLIPGSDGTGVTEDGREVIVQPGSGWGDDPRFQGKHYQILGLPDDGTFAECTAVEAGQLYDKPSHLTYEEAATLPLAGLTAYRVLFTRCRLLAGEKVLITGVGGGVALFCLQFALAVGAQVFVTSGSDAKIERAISMGVTGGANYKEVDWAKRMGSMAGGFDVVIDSAGGDGFAHLVKLCNPGGRIGIYGGSKGAMHNISPQIIFWKQLSIVGSTMGNDEDFGNMLALVNRHQIVPVVDKVYPLEEGAAAFERMEQGKQFGKIVLKIA